MALQIFIFEEGSDGAVNLLKVEIAINAYKTQEYSTA